MNIVGFPMLGLEFSFSKVAFTIFGLQVYKYAVCIVLGIALALILMKISKVNFGIKYEDVLKCAIWTIIFGTIGARLFYVIFSFGWYKNNLGEIFALKHGGMAIYGGLIAGALTMFVYCTKKKINYLDMLDYVVPFVALTQAIGRWGNFFNIEAYGSETRFILGMEIPNGAVVHPVFLYESLFCFGLFIALFIYQRRRRYSGEIALYYLLGYGVARFLLEGLRADSLMLFNQRVSQYISGMIVLACVMYLYYRKKYIEKPTNTKD